MDIKSKRKWNVVTNDDKTMILFADTKEELINSFNVKSITENKDYSYLKYIENLYELSNE